MFRSPYFFVPLKEERRYIIKVLGIIEDPLPTPPRTSVRTLEAKVVKTFFKKERKLMPPDS